MHRLLYVHSRFVRPIIVYYIFLCTPDNSTMQCLFHWLFLHSNSGITENMFHIQPYCQVTQASCMCNTLGGGNSLDVCMGWMLWTQKWFHLLIFQALHNMYSRTADWRDRCVRAALIWMSENTSPVVIRFSVSRGVWTQYTVGDTGAVLAVRRK